KREQTVSLVAPRDNHLPPGRHESHLESNREASGLDSGKNCQSARLTKRPAAEKRRRKNNATPSFLYQLIIFNNRIRKQIATKLMQARFYVCVVALEIDLQVFPNPHVFDFAHSEVLHCVPHGCALRIEDGRLWHHHHLGFHLFNLRVQSSRANVVLPQENSFKAPWVALVVAAKWTLHQSCKCHHRHQVGWGASPRGV